MLIQGDYFDKGMEQSDIKNWFHNCSCMLTFVCLLLFRISAQTVVGNNN